MHVDVVLINHKSISIVKTPMPAWDEIQANTKSVNSNTMRGAAPQALLQMMFVIDLILVA